MAPMLHVNLRNPHVAVFILSFEARLFAVPRPFHFSHLAAFPDRHAGITFSTYICRDLNIPTALIGARGSIDFIVKCFHPALHVAPGGVRERATCHLFNK